MPKTLLKDGIQFECPEKAKALKLWSDGKKNTCKLAMVDNETTWDVISTLI